MATHSSILGRRAIPRTGEPTAYEVAKSQTRLSTYSATASRHAHLIGVGDLVIRIF